MVRGVMYSVALSLLLIYGVYRLQDVYHESLAQQPVRVDIYEKYIAYRNNHFTTPGHLGIGIKATQEPPEAIIVHDCNGMKMLADVLTVLREQGITTVDVELPENC